MDPTNRNTALASVFVEELARCGVRHAALSPGSRSTPLALALWRSSDIEVSVHIDERCAGFWALGAALATGTPAAVLTTSGTAAANLHPAVAEADEAGVPLIVLTADRPPELRGIGAGQTIDQIKLFGDATRWFCEVGTPSADDAGVLYTRSTACRAFALAAGDPTPGPVHLNLALTEPLGPEPDPGSVTATDPLAVEGRDGRPLTTVIPARPEAFPELVDALAERVEGIERGLILAGRRRSGDHRDGIAALGAATGFPILAEPTSQLRCGPHDRSQVICGYGEIARQRPAELEPELVLRFGDMPTSKQLRLWLGDSAAPILVIDEAHRWNEPSRRAGAVVRADPAAVATALAERGGSGPGTWLDAWRAAEADLSPRHGEELDEPAVAAAVGAEATDGEIVYAASSMPVRDLEACCPSTPSDVLFLSNRGANGIDGTVSSAAGAAAASGRPVTLLLGDLALVHDLGGLRALRETDAPVRIVCIDNGGGGIFHFLPQAEQVSREEFEGLFGTPSGLEVERIAALFDLPYARPGTREELAEVLRADRHVLAHIEVERPRGALRAAGVSYS